MKRNNLPDFNDIDTCQILPELNHLIETARSSLADALKGTRLLMIHWSLSEKRLKITLTTFGRRYHSYKRFVTKRRSGKSMIKVF